MSKQIQEHPSVTFLRASPISEVLFEGFAELYLRKPKFPINFLANFLLNHSKKTKNLKKIQESLDLKKEIRQEQNLKEFKLKSQLKEQQQKRHQVESKYEQMLENIRTRHYTEDLIVSELPNFIINHFKLSACYIGLVTFKFKPVSPLDFQLNSHLDQQGGKVIRYVGTSLSQQFLAEKYLTAESGVTWPIFQDKPPDQSDQTNPQIKDKEVFIEQVVVNDKVYFFRIPKLGSYYALPLIIESRREQSVFDSALQEVMKYNQVKSEFDKQCQRKQSQFRQSLEEKAKAGVDDKQLQELQTKFNEEKQLWESPKSPQFNSLKKQYCVCMDTLGYDQPISLQNRNKIRRLVKFLQEEWNKKELGMLTDDINNHSQYSQCLQGPLQDILAKLQEQQDKEIDNNQSVLEPFKDNQRQLVQQQDNLRLSKLKDILMEQKTVQWLSYLSKYKVVKFPLLIQIWLIFLGHKKEEINIPKTNVLNWRKVAPMVNHHLVQKLINYNFRGAKIQNRLNYAKINVLQSKLQRIQLPPIQNYNIALAKIYRYLQLLFKLRKNDILIRKEQFAKRKQRREEIILENQKMMEEKYKNLEEHKGKLTPEQLEVFDEQAWDQAFQDSHHLNEVPEEQQAQTDDDFQFEDSAVGS